MTGLSRRRSRVRVPSLPYLPTADLEREIGQEGFAGRHSHEFAVRGSLTLMVGKRGFESPSLPYFPTPTTNWE